MSDEAWALLHDLVATPSPSGDEAAAAALLRDWLAARRVDATIDAAGNVRAVAGDGPLHVLLAGHIDCVEPFLPAKVDGDTLWGRGSVDAKGPLSAFAAATVAPPEGLTIHFAALTGEEADSRGAHHLLTDPPRVHAVVVGEPSGAHAVTLGYKGSLRVEATWDVDTAHPGHPDATAAERMVAGWQRLVATCGNPTLDPSPKLLTPRLVATTSGTGTASAGIDLRLPVGGNLADARALLGKTLHDARVEVLDATPPYAGDRGSVLAAAFRAAIRAHGGTPRLLVKSGTADLNLLAPALDVPGVAYGPGDSALDHRPDERITRREFEDGVRVLHDALDRLGA